MERLQGCFSWREMNVSPRLWQILLETPPPDAWARADTHQVHMAFHPQQGRRRLREPGEGPGFHI